MLKKAIKIVVLAVPVMIGGRVTESSWEEPVNAQREENNAHLAINA